jgi:hypothetical protein
MGHIAPVEGGMVGGVRLREQFGPVMTLKVGGQELWINQVCAHPQ